MGGPHLCLPRAGSRLRGEWDPPGHLWGWLRPVRQRGSLPRPLSSAASRGQLCQAQHGSPARGLVRHGPEAVACWSRWGGLGVTPEGWTLSRAGVLRSVTLGVPDTCPAPRRVRWCRLRGGGLEGSKGGEHGGPGDSRQGHRERQDGGLGASRRFIETSHRLTRWGQEGGGSQGGGKRVEAQSPRGQPEARQGAGALPGPRVG